ncbi:MAG: pyridoxamine 5'-phosphate oxidase family protein [Spirochaetota bacterium]
MDSRSMLDTLERVLEDSKIAVLATVDVDGRPHMRWMTPGIVRGRDGFLYAVTSPEFPKAKEIDGNAHVEWMLQSKSLDEIVIARGPMQAIDNPSVKAEVLEAIGGHLATFWHLNPDEGKMVVLETSIEELRYMRPMTGERHEIKLGGGNG